MGFFAKNAIIKKILIVLIIIIIISNFIMPNYVHAESVGEQLVEGFFYLIAYVGDAGIMLMQDLMMGTSDIKDADGYNIKYSPGIIFSNIVPALDINFISPMEETNYETIPQFNNTTTGYSKAIEILSKLKKEDFGNEPIEVYTKFTQSVPDEVKEKYGYEASKSVSFKNKNRGNDNRDYSKKFFKS